MKAAAEGVQDRLSDSKIELRIVATDDVGSLRADGRRIRQVLFNLLSNAIGFSAAGQTVTLAAMRRGDEIVFKSATAAAASRPKCSTASSTASRAIPAARAIAAPASACRSSGRWSSCTAAGFRSTRSTARARR